MAAKGPGKRMQGLLGEFKKLYEERLSKLKSKPASSSATAISKEDTLTNYEVNLSYFWFTEFMACSPNRLNVEIIKWLLSI